MTIDKMKTTSKKSTIEQKSKIIAMMAHWIETQQMRSTMNRNESHNKFALAVLSQLNKINIVYNGFIEYPISYTVV